MKLTEGVTFFGMIFKKYSADFFKKAGTLQVISEENLTLKNIKYRSSPEKDFLKVFINYEGIPIENHVKEGRVLRSILQGGLLTYVAEELGSSEKKEKDLLFVTSVRNTGKFVSKPRKSTKIKFKIKGSLPENIPSCLQKIEKKQNGFYHITVESNGNCNTIKDTKQFLKANLFEDKDSEAVRKVSKKWRNHPKNKKLAEEIASFVFDTIKSKSYKYGNLTASEVLEKKEGDCTEHATLFSAILKSLEIPVRMVYGLVLDNGNRLFFHNWNEVFVDGKWISADPTFNQFPADSARIALVYLSGDDDGREKVSLTILKLLNKISVSVEEFSYE